ncbi:stress-response A/B barrel domain-containing protein HS1-like [Macadamia integrifolia]|uniref:stress-response A/B barrel domain-containing protein HS1-like n=1 Tax=Macadamia integrifolia TaxID=60698 RepID=UPI001C4ED609|nr:stress-response A/B barrel domain-containing protein HS1-like [Macadamia integrifolia]
MEESKGLVKHVLLAKFKDDLPPEKVDEIIKSFANLVNLIDCMKSFHGGKDVSPFNMHEGFTHVFEATFESLEAVNEYAVHPDHVEFADLLRATTEKFIVVDYIPTYFNL